MQGLGAQPLSHVSLFSITQPLVFVAMTAVGTNVFVAFSAAFWIDDGILQWLAFAIQVLFPLYTTMCLFGIALNFFDANVIHR